MRTLVAALLLINAAAAAALEFTLSLDSINHPAFAAERLRVQDDASGTRLDIARLRAAGREWRDLFFKCRELSRDAGDLRCRGGALKVGAGETAPLDFHYFASRRTLELTLRDAPLASLAGLLPELAAWQQQASPSGKLRGIVRLTGTRAELDLTVSGAAIANAAGTRAAEGISLRLSGLAQQSGGAWQWQTAAEWQGGEAYWQPWYVKAAGQRLEAQGTLDEEALQVASAHLALPRVGALDGEARWDRRRGMLTDLKLKGGDWQAGEAWTQFGQPLLGESPKVQAAGTTRFSLALDESGLSSVDLDLALESIDVGDGRLALKDFRADVPWRRSAATQARITAAGGKVGDLAFGAVSVPLAMEGWSFRFPHVEVPLLDSRLLFEDFAARRTETEWYWRLAAALEPVSMPRLTRALRLPSMAGTISATMPRMRYRDGTLSLDGTMIISVFDGYLAVDGLRVIEPFGRAPRVAADVSARHLDLAMLTDTFSFGNITGYVDAEVRGLDLSGWQPAAFDARVATSAGDFKKRISRRAVRNISSLGGGASAGAAVEASVVGFFDSFGYERLGLGCRLLAGVCTMGGLEDREHGYLIVQGGGLPSLNVMGYNRRVGWDVFVSRLRDVAAGNSKPVIE